MALPVKPTNPTLITGHSFLTDLVGAWLFVEGTGATVADYSGFNHHISIQEGIDHGWTAADGVIKKIVVTNSLEAASDYSEYRHTSAEPWTQIFWLKRTGPGLGTFQRLCWRVNNVVDMGFQSNDNYGPAFFTGAAWINFQKGSSVSGADEMWAFAYDGSNMLVYKGDTSGVTLLHSSARSLAATDKIAFVGSNTEQLEADWIANFYHRRALGITELSSHYSNPWQAFTIIPPPPPPVGEPYLGMIERNYYRHDDSYQGGSQHLLDWLAGGN